MGEFIAGLLVAAFAVFVYTRVQKSKDKPKGGSTSGGAPSDPSKNQLK